MFRAVLTGLLIAISAWPHAICVCHSLHATSHSSSNTDDQSSRSDEDDDDDVCTCCKLRQVLADPVVPMLHDTSDDAVAGFPVVGFASADRPRCDAPQANDQLHFAADQPSLWMLCALRI